MMSKLLLSLFFFFFFCIASFSQTKSINAVKINQSIKIDGTGDAIPWQKIPYVSGFVTSSPVFGKEADKTHVKVAYDNSAVYVLAYMHDSPENIKRQLTARDDIDDMDVDVFSIGLDTYDDKQNAFLFKVSASGVQEDAKLSTIEDKTWDAVWESKVSIKKNGWIAEIKIPLSAIRFSPANLQTWGIQFTRFRRVNNEVSTWSPDDPKVGGTMNKWGEWVGLQNIHPCL